MSAPVKKGDLTTAVDEVLSGASVTTSGGYVTNVSQSKAFRAAAPAADGPAPDYNELTRLVEESSLENNVKDLVKRQLERLKVELGKENDGDIAAVQDSLKSVSVNMPALRPKLKLWIEKSPHASQPIQIVARNMLG